MPIDKVMIMFLLMFFFAEHCRQGSLDVDMQPAEKGALRDFTLLSVNASAALSQRHIAGTNVTFSSG